MKKALLIFLALTIVSTALILMMEPDGLDSPAPASAGQTEPEFDPAKLEAAKKSLNAEPKILEFVYDPAVPVQWHIGVADDGTKRWGYANYVCGLLVEHGVVKTGTHVRVVDYKKVYETGASFRGASLGRVDCTTFERFPT